MSTYIILAGIVVSGFAFVMWLGIFLLNRGVNTNLETAAEGRRNVAAQLGYGAVLLGITIVLSVVFFQMDREPIIPPLSEGMPLKPPVSDQVPISDASEMLPALLFAGIVVFGFAFVLWLAIYLLNRSIDTTFVSGEEARRKASKQLSLGALLLGATLACAVLFIQLERTASEAHTTPLPEANVAAPATPSTAESKPADEPNVEPDAAPHRKPASGARPTGSGKRASSPSHDDLIPHNLNRGYIPCCDAPFLGLLYALVFSISAAANPTFSMVPMGDGTKLATDVHLPGGEAPWPVILLRSTYGRMGAVATEWLKQNYAVVIQDVRGMGDSEGEPHVFYADGWREKLTDGADTVAWVKAQPWCDGAIATRGGSALAITEMLLAPTTPDLRIQHMVATPSNLYFDTAYHGGVLRKRLIEGWLTAIKQPHIIEVYKSHPRYDDYWAHFDTLSKAADINVPGIFENGWYDIFQQGTIDGFVARQTQSAPPAKGNNYLIMKWSSHGPEVEEDYKLSANRHDLKISALRNRIFRHYLRENDDISDIPAVHYYVMGADTPGAPGNEWRAADAWPPYETTATTFYLHEGGDLSTDTPSGSGSQSYLFDPANPVPTHGGNNLLAPSGAFDQRENTADRKDILHYMTAPLDAPVEITGRVTLRLNISTDAPDTDFTAMLLDVYPDGDGRQLNVLDNIRRVKTRNGYKEAAPLLTGPDEIVVLEIDSWSTAWVFDKGHRIGLNISSSNFPRFEVNPNTGEDFPGDELRKATNTVHLSAEHSSVLVLPVR